MPADRDRDHHLRWLLLGAMLIGTATGTLANSLVNVALPTILDYFSVDVGTGIWAVTIYILLFAVTMPLFGRLGDMYGYKRAYLIGMCVFAISSLLTPLAQNFSVLIILRAIQGVGNGPILPAIMGVVGTLFPPGERGRAMGAWALVNSAFHAAGPPLSGLLTQYFGWQSIFLVYSPLCIVAVLLVWRLMPDDSKHQRQSFDAVGAVALTVATLTLMFNLRQGTYLGWLSPLSLTLWVVCFGFLAGFFITEKRVEQPFVDLKLFSNRPYSAASTIAFAQAFCQFGLLFLIPLFLIEVRGYPAVQTGMTLASLPVTMAVAAPIAGRLADRYGCRLLCLAGTGVVAVSGLALSLLGSTVSPWYIVACLVLTGVGMGMIQSPAPAAVSIAVPAQKLGIALGLFNLLRFLGGTLGPTAFALVVQSFGAGFALQAFRVDFYLVTIVAVLAVFVGAFVPGTQSAEPCAAEQ